MTTPNALDALAATAPIGAVQTTGTHNGKPFDVESWLATHDIKIKSKDSYEGGWRFILEECPFNPEHKATSAAAFQNANGIPGFK